MGLPLVSFVIPAFNAEATIGDTLRSLSACGCDDFEVIVVDDGSTDNTFQVASKEAAAYPHTVMRLGANTGASIASNFSISYAKGRYLARMDADDICRQDRVRLQIEHMEKNTDVAFCGGAIKIFGEQNHTLRYPTGISECLGILPAHCCYSHPAITFDRTRIKSQIYYDPRFEVAQDYDLWARLCAQHIYGDNIDFVCVEYRTHESQLTSAKKDSLFLDGLLIRQKMISNMLHHDNLFISYFLALHLTSNISQSHPEYLSAAQQMVETARPLVEFIHSWVITKKYILSTFDFDMASSVKQKTVQDLTSFALFKYGAFVRKSR